MRRVMGRVLVGWVVGTVIAAALAVGLTNLLGLTGEVAFIIGLAFGTVGANGGMAAAMVTS
jgi:hypothetical protein